MFVPIQPEQQLPSAIEAEENVIGGILLDPSAIITVKPLLEPDDFFISSHREIYEACLALHKRGKPTDLMSCMNWLADKGRLEAIGGMGKLALLVDRTISAHNIDRLAEIIREKSLARRLWGLSQELSASVVSRSTNLADIFTEYQNRFSAIKQSFAAAAGVRERSIEFDILDQELQDIEAVEDPARREWLLLGLTKRWGFKSLRELLNFHAKWIAGKTRIHLHNPLEYFEKFGANSEKWLLQGWIPEKRQILVHAGGGVGKTRLIMSMIKHLIAGENWGDYEIDQTHRVLLIQSDQSSAATCKLLDIQGFLALPAAQLANLSICSEWNIEDMGALRKAIAHHKPSLVVIDSLTSVSASSIYSENDVEYARPLVRMRALQDEFGCSFLVIHHSNKDGNARGSTAIKNTVDEVWRLEKDSKDPNGLRNLLTIEKTRSRAPGQYRLAYDEEAWVWQVEDRMEGDKPAPKSSCRRTILDFLKQRGGTGYQAIELSELLMLNKDTLRRELATLCNEGLISSCRGKLRRLLYYWGQYPINIEAQEKDQKNQETGLTELKPDLSQIPVHITNSACIEQERSEDHQIFDRPLEKNDDLSDLSPEPLAIASSQKDHKKDHSVDLSDLSHDQIVLKKKTKFKIGDRVRSEVFAEFGQIVEKLDGGYYLVKVGERQIKCPADDLSEIWTIKEHEAFTALLNCRDKETLVDIRERFPADLLKKVGDHLSLRKFKQIRQWLIELNREDKANA